MMMSQSSDLKNLILLIDKNRPLLANSQYYFDLSSQAREALHMLSKYAVTITNEAEHKIEQHFYETLYWTEHSAEIEEAMGIWLWSLAYNNALLLLLDKVPVSPGELYNKLFLPRLQAFLDEIDLIQMIDQYRDVIGNSQFCFDLGSENREVLDRFAHRAHIIRRDAKQKIEDLFFEELRWATDDRTIVIPLTSYMWLLAYNTTQRIAAEGAEAVAKDVFEVIFSSKLAAYIEASARPLNTRALRYIQEYALSLLITHMRYYEKDWG